MAVMHWVVAIVGIFFVSFIYIIGSIVITENLIPALNKTIATPNEQTAYERITNAWNLWPWIAIGGFLLMGVLSSQRREFDTGAEIFG